MTKRVISFGDVEDLLSDFYQAPVRIVDANRKKKKLVLSVAEIGIKCR